MIFSIFLYNRCKVYMYSTTIILHIWNLAYGYLVLGGGWEGVDAPGTCECAFSTIFMCNCTLHLVHIHPQLCKPIRHRNFCARTECWSLGEQLPPFGGSVLLGSGINKISSSD